MILPIVLSALTVAVTFDDLPCNRAEGATAQRQTAINAAIVATLKERAIPAVGFVNEAQLTDRAVLALWLDAGLDLGNHTYSHPDLHQVGKTKFLEEIVLGERVTRALLEARGRSMRWFRHPYLHTGLDLDTKHAVEEFVANRGLKVAPVTIDNSEWIFARAYLDAADDAARAKIARIGWPVVECRPVTMSSLLAWTEWDGGANLRARLAGTAGVAWKLLLSRTTLPGCFRGMCP